jgi:hypothetical protein
VPARWFALFLGELSRSGIVTAAAERANEATPLPFEQWVRRRAVIDWREADEDFHQECCDAEQEAVDRAEGELRRRAIEG